MKVISKFWIGLSILIILSPLGLLLPEHFKAGGAWGEWGTGEIQKLAGYIPQGIQKLSTLWNAPLRGYNFKFSENNGFAHLSLGYIICAATGAAITVIAVFLIGKMLSKKGD